jgi:hypothetical protein
MPKPERGLPKTFDIKVPDTPVQLGDYLDEQLANPQAEPAAEPRLPPDPVPPQPVAVPMPPPSAAPEPTPGPRVASARRGPPRKQFNMTPETLRMLDELLAHVRLHSAERDLRASELIHALVLAGFEVRPFLDLSGVSPRGKWGSATAAMLPLSLKEAFQAAIANSRLRGR